MRPLSPIALATLLLFSACPQRDPGLPPIKPETADDYSAFGQRIATEAGLRQELKDLQARWADPPDPLSISPGGSQELYRLSSFTREQACGLVLTGSGPEDAWELRGWDGTELKTGPVKVVTDEPTPGGYRFVGSTGEGGGLTVTFNARWVQGRFLQITREIEIAGGDVTLRLPFEATAWTLSGPSLPLRLLPGDRGPYGAAPPYQRDGSWQEYSYPWDLALPAVAAYGPAGGMLLSPVDEHQRILSRSYHAGFRVAPGAVPGELLRVGLEQFDPTADRYGAAYLVSGLPLRESVAIAPLQMSGGTDFRLTLKVIDELAALCHGFVAAPKLSAEPAEGEPAPQLAKTCVLAPADWGNWLPEPPGGVRSLLGWDQVAAAILPVSADRYISILNPTDSLGDAGTQLNDVAAVGAPTVAVTWLYSPLRGSRISRLGNGALLAATTIPDDPQQWLELRNPEVAAWAGRAAKNVGLAISPATYLAHDWWTSPLPPPQQGQFAGSWTAAACAVELSQAAGAPVPPPVMLGLPRPCRPAYASAVVLTNAAAEDLDSSSRCKAYLAWAVFGVDAYMRGVEDNLASLLLASGAGASGVVLTEGSLACAGAESFCAKLDGLSNRLGEVALHFPAATSGQGDDGRACVMFPADLQGESTLWLGFIGVNGSVAVDEHNLMTVAYGEDSFAITLPAGYWKPLHPDPLRVKVGDVVVVSKGFISAPDTNPSSDDTI